jgi:amino acid transporter
MSQENIPLVKNDTMKVIQFRYKKIVIIITLIAFAFVAYTQIVWAVVAAHNSEPQSEKVQLFLQYFPPFLRDIAAITYATLICSIIVIILSSIWSKKDSGINKVIATSILIITILIVLLTLFQLM